MMIVLVTICCRFGSRGLVKNLNVCSDFEQKVWSRFWSWSSGKIWSWSLVSSFLLMFCRMLNPRWILVWSLFCCWCFMWLWNSILVKILKLGLVKILKLKFYGEADVWLRFWRWSWIKICVWTCDQKSTVGSVVPLAMFIFLLAAPEKSCFQVLITWALSNYPSSLGFLVLYSTMFSS